MKMNVGKTVLLFIFLLIYSCNSSNSATSIINKPQSFKKKPKYHNWDHHKLKSKQTCQSSIHCNDSVTIEPLKSTIICIAPTLNTDQLTLITPIDNFGSITADIFDGSYTQNIYIPPDSSKYLTTYYGFDNNYYPNISIPLRFIPPSINITHDITIQCMKCNQNICGQTITSNNGKIQRFCVETHVNSDNPSYISQFVFVCDIGYCLVQVYDYTNELQFSANIPPNKNKEIEFNDFNLGEVYTIEFAGNLEYKSDSNTSKLRIGCYDPLLHTINVNKVKHNTNHMQNVQKLGILLTMVAIMGAVIVLYLMQKCPSQSRQNLWDDL